jgi:hypothetical protein
MRHRTTVILSALLLAATGIAAGVASARDGKAPGTADPRQIEVKLRILSLDRGPDGATKEHVLQAPVVRTMDGRSGKVAVTSTAGPVTRQLSNEVLPSLNPDGSITLYLSVRDADEGGPEETVRTVTATRRLQPNKAVRIEGLTMNGAASVIEVSASEVHDKPTHP